jgi:hypothetical protein
MQRHRAETRSDDNEAQGAGQDCRYRDSHSSGMEQTPLSSRNHLRTESSATHQFKKARCHGFETWPADVVHAHTRT